MEELVQNLDAGQVILDLGAGGGSFRYATTRARVVAVDLAFPRTADPLGNQVIADALRLPIRDRSVDLIISNNSLEHFADPSSCLREMLRVIRTDGRVWISVPDSRSLDDRLYRFLFAGGGHLSQFSLEDLLTTAEQEAGFRPLTIRRLHTGLVYLNPPDPSRLPFYPRRSRFLFWLPPRLLRRGIRWLTWMLRLADRRLGTQLSAYGWAITFSPGPDSPEPVTLPPLTNVCLRCGASRPAATLEMHRRIFLRVYTCPSCGEINFWSPDQDSRSREKGELEGNPEKTLPAHRVELLEHIARGIFGPEHRESIRHWVDFWDSSEERARMMLNTFHPLFLFDLKDKRVLDVGCGNGGMGQVLKHRCRLYAGVDDAPHIIALARQEPGIRFVRASGTRLPFPDGFFDCVFALDVLEHVQGGLQEQVAFLRELRRVTTPLGVICLSTPNRWYPYEGHTGLLGPQYLPRRLADRYIRRFNPGFLEEHRSFSEITSLSPRRFRRSLKLSRLSFLHDLPCGLDRADYQRHFPLRGLLAWLGLGWYPHAEFWGILARSEARDKLRLKIPKHWIYEQRQPSPTGVSDFGPVIDFERGFFNPQLDSGWYWLEQDRIDYRWISRRAVCFLQTAGHRPLFKCHGYTPGPNRLFVRINDLLIGERILHGAEEFNVTFLNPFPGRSQNLWKIEIECERTLHPDPERDKRDLGVMLFSLGLFPDDSHETDFFSSPPEAEESRKSGTDLMPAFDLYPGESPDPQKG